MHTQQPNLLDSESAGRVEQVGPRSLYFQQIHPGDSEVGGHGLAFEN